MIGKFVQKLIQWMPLILFILLLMVDRENQFHVVGYIILLLSYTVVLILRILYAKEKWHRDYDGSSLGTSPSIQKMSDLKDQLEQQDGSDSES
jgi:hypothetical protein